MRKEPEEKPPIRLVAPASALLLPLLLCALDATAAPAPAPSPTHLTFQGILADTAFAPALPEGAIRLEVLETGDTLAVTPGKPFRVRLPADTLWNLCFAGPARRATAQGDSAVTGDPVPTATEAAAPGNPIEKCFEVRHAGPDTLFSATLGEGPATVIAAPAEAPAAATAADSVAPEEAAPEAVRPEDAVTLKKVVLRAQRAPKRSLGKSTVSAKLIKRMPGLAEADVIRSIQALPGVVASSDFSTKIYVRGGGADQNLILLDNAVVYSPVHFFGLFSTFLVEAIDKVDFYKGGFPPEYGNRLSSVLDIASRKGGKDTAESWFQGSSVKVSTFASQAHTEGRKGPVRWLVAGRRTYIDQMLELLRGAGATDLDLPYAFYDLQGSVHYDLGGGNSLLASFYQGRDELVFAPIEVDWGNTVLPLNATFRLPGGWTSQTSASYSLFSQSFGLQNVFSLYNRIATWNLKQSFEYAGLESHRLAFGVDSYRMKTTFANDVDIQRLFLQDDRTFWLNSLFAQDRWTRGDAEWTSGARLTQSSTLDLPTVEPRLSLKYRLPGNQSLDLHTGWYAQYINSIQFQDQENLNEFYYPAQKLKTRTVKPTTSLLLSAGWSAEKVRDNWDLSAEAYYKTLNRITVFAPNELPDSLAERFAELRLGDMFKEAEGYSYGFELSLRRPEGLLFGGVSYSYGTAVLKENGADTSYFPNWHQPHSMKADLAINWRGKDGLWPGSKPGRYLRSSTQLKYASGLPYTPEIGYLPSHLLEESPGRSTGGPVPEFPGNVNTIKGSRNGAFVPAYFRWDAKVVDWGREGKWNFALTLINLTNHENVFLYTYDRQTNPPTRQTITQFPFFPLLVSYEYYF